MTISLDRLRSIPLLADLSDEDLEKICDTVTEVRVPAGELLFVEGEWGDAVYIVTAGEVEIVKQVGSRENLLAVRGPDSVIGEMSLLQETPRNASGRARTDVVAVAIGRSALDTLLETSPSAAKALFRVMLERWRVTEVRMRQNERMAQLGTLTAGLAHELNNPAAAVKRGAGVLRDAISRYAAARADVEAIEVDDAGRAELRRLESEVEAAVASPPSLDVITRSDREGAVEDWLGGHGVPRAWELTPSLVELGFDEPDLDRIADAFGDGAGPVVAFLAESATVAGLLREVEEGANRLSMIVRALKGYSYLDQAPVQAVRVSTGIDDTLLILKRKLDGIRIRREYDPAGPEIEAFGSELNQVWTNLVDNAADALADAGVDDPEIVVRTRPGPSGGAVVEIEDNGPGIPKEVVGRIFDAFFTTKPPGSGTGLGLDITRQIIQEKHGGDISVESEPGRTRFRVELPPRPPREWTEPRDGRSAERGAPMQAPCEHLESIPMDEIPDDGCVDCLAIGGTWLHLRYCVTCRQIRCCNDSPNRHAQKHFESTGHPVIRSAEPGEAWAWCYAHNTGMELEA